MAVRRTLNLAASAMACALLCTSIANATDVSFQGRTYTIGVTALGPTVSVSGSEDLIFVTLTDGTKLLAIPTSGVARGDFDRTNQRFYMIDDTTGQVSAYATIDATLVSLNGAFRGTTTQSPPSSSAPLEAFSRPLVIPSTINLTDCTVYNSQQLIYRGDGLAANSANVYFVTRTASTTVAKQFAVPLNNADPNNSNRNVYLTYDGINDTILFTQSALDPNQNATTVSRITSLNAGTGTFNSDLIFSTALFPGFSGVSLGVTMDPVTGVIYVLDAASRQIFTLTPRVPAIFSVNPTSGPIAGGTKVTINGVNFPQDATVAFGGVAATGVSVNTAGTVIIATTPPHAGGIVDVTLTGSGISGTAPVKLANAYNYVAKPPIARLTASPATGAFPPLVVTFSTAGTTAVDGKITFRAITFGDGDTYTFPSDLNVTQATHTYAFASTFVATLTVRTDLGLSSTAQATVLIGNAELTLRSLQFNIVDPAKKNKADSMSLKAELVLPDSISLANGSVIVGFVSGDADTDGALLTDPVRQSIDFRPAVTGGEFTSELVNGATKTPQLNFKAKAIKKNGQVTTTQTITFSTKGVTYQPFNPADPATFTLRNALENAGVLQSDQPSVARIRLILRFTTADNQTAQYIKLAVVKVRSKKSVSISLTRR